MAKGYLTGFLVGTLVSGIAIGAVSLRSPLEKNEPDAAKAAVEGAVEETQVVDSDLSTLETDTSDQAATSEDATPEITPEIIPDDTSENADAIETSIVDETQDPIMAEPSEAVENDAQPVNEVAITPTLQREPAVPLTERATDGQNGLVMSADTPKTPSQDQAEAPEEQNAVEEARQDLGDISRLPFPVSFIVDGGQADALDIIATYKAAGFEVLLQPTLPENATPIDAEVNFQVQSHLFENTVAAFLPVSSGFQSDSPLATQISQILLEQGHGVLAEQSGLNTGYKTALKTGVFAGVVFRDLNGKGANDKIIQRFLDNAAFKAGQQKGVILVGDAIPETLQALIEWSLGSRAKSVALAPVSTVLLGQ